MNNLYYFRFLTVLLIAGLTMASPKVGSAQNTDTTGTILPNLSPQEVEIRGQLEISFPSLQRQPLIGFNPPPRVPEVPEGYRPYTEAYKLFSSRLPNQRQGNLGNRDGGSLLNTLPPSRGELEASAGRYLSRVIRARLGGPISEKASVYARVDYEGTEGYSPESTIDDLRNPYDGLRSVFGFQSSGPRVGGGFELKGEVNSFTLFGTNFLQNGTFSSDIVLPDRNGLNGIMEFWLSTYNESTIASDFRISFGSSRYRTDLFDQALMPLSRLNQQEQRLTGSASLDIPFSLGSFLLAAEVSSSGLDQSALTASIEDFSLFEFKNYYLDAQSGFRVSLSPKVSLTIAGHFLGTSFLENNEEEFISYLTANADLSIYPMPGLTFYVRNRPSIESNTLWDIFEKNPYVRDQPLFQSTLRPLDAQAGFSFYKGMLQLAANVGYVQTPNYLYFEHIPDQPITGYDYSRGVFDAIYGDVDILHANGTISLALSNELHLKFGIAVREAELTDTNEEIPYFSPFVSENMISYSFANNSMLVQVLSTLKSSRFRSRTDQEKIPGYVDLDFLYTYMLNSGLGFVVRFDNILGDPLEYWEHYQESPFMVSAGIRVLW